MWKSPGSAEMLEIADRAMTLHLQLPPPALQRGRVFAGAVVQLPDARDQLVDVRVQVRRQVIQKV